ncbi:DHA1 family bicyclomycin/chloramphenicol resistance-like MFS transporter [Paenibacillus cellulosilyticus]|uniref:Bcr/CflA family efflux transporter n=1 Tax=Paenibacillus cellulosilyticus TaxID=375489 RepID=A0A2V2YTU7_9BACL|nr:multidrug effflux MFS transporter [Paenibacillus cellulosilyticus]PWW02845.1 DHA1 family bicyclomycin/chloramphenicol resistance-like MFS transporter [Paenibacillus cellulosilyticus]QKS45762.1 multidrug effflux MFS transporter [Paenibacillus cellulosilyticus]
MSDNDVRNHPSLKLALMLSAFSALGPFTVDMYLASLPQIMDDFDTNASLIQASLTASLLGLGLGQLVMGPLSDRYGRRKPLLMAMILYIAASIGCAAAPHIELFIAVRFIQGIAASAGLVISRAIARDRYSGVRMTKFISLLTTISNIAPLISPNAGSAVLSYSSWIGVFVFLAMLGILLTAISLWGVEESLPIERRVRGSLKTLVENYISLFRDRSFMGYALLNGILFAGIFAFVAGTPFIYQNIYGLSPVQFSILFAMNGLAIMVGSQLVKSMAGRMSERLMIGIGLSLSFVSTAAILIAVLSYGSLWTVFGSTFLFAISIGIIGPMSITLAMEPHGQIAGSASAVLGTLQFALGAVISPFVGIAGENSAIPFGIVMLVTSVLAIVSYIVVVRSDAADDDHSKAQSIIRRSKRGI